MGTLLALLSVSIQRTGPEMVRYSDLCTAADPGPCYKPALKGGFPLAYLFDAPGISVERKLAFEDRLDGGALVFDIAVYFLICLAAPAVLRRRAARRA